MEKIIYRLTDENLNLLEDLEHDPEQENVIEISARIGIQIMFEK